MLNKLLFHSLAIVMCALLFACSSSKQISPSLNAAVQPAGDYKIGVGDTLQINVWRNPELSTTLPVRPDGKISIALVGDVQAANLTAVDLAKNMNEILLHYIRNPQVTVTVMNSFSGDFQQRVRVTGAVNAPQSLPYREGMTVLDLVLIAGGPSDFASANKAKLYRTTSTGLEVYNLRLDDMLKKGKIETNYTLQPLDIITIPERLF